MDTISGPFCKTANEVISSRSSDWKTLEREWHQKQQTIADFKQMKINLSALKN